MRGFRVLLAAGIAGCVLEGLIWFGIIAQMVESSKVLH